MAQEPTAAPAPSSSPGVTEQDEVPSFFRSKDDGWFDVGGFLDTKFGFLPIVVPITKPDHQFQRADLLGLQYFELDSDLFLDLRAEIDASFCDAPFCF